MENPQRPMDCKECCNLAGHAAVERQGPEMIFPLDEMDRPLLLSDSTAHLHRQVSVLRAELKNVRMQLDKARRVHSKDVEEIKAMLRQEVSPAVRDEAEVQVAAPRRRASPGVCSLETGNLTTCPVGYVESCFPTKNGTPRQPSVCAASRARLRLDKSVFSNAEHSLDGLQHFSHVWILFVFHKNGPSAPKAKVKPPRLNGLKVGVFSTRSPHRPNPIGLSLARLEKIEGGMLYLSGIDMIDGTPVLDIKPYIPEYDVPVKVADVETAAATVKEPEVRDSSPDGECVGSFGNDNCINTRSAGSEERVATPKETRSCAADAVEEPLADEALEAGEGSCASTADCTELPHRKQNAVASWVREAPVKNLEVRFTPHAEQELQQLANAAHKGSRSGLRHLVSAEEARRAATAVLSADPRSAYRRRSCRDQLFYFHLDVLHFTCWFGDGFAEVLRVGLARPVIAADVAAVPPVQDSKE